MSPSASASPDATLPPGAGQGLLRPSPWSPPSHMPISQHPCEATMVLLQGGTPVGQRDAFSGPSRILIRRSEMPSSAVRPHGLCWPLPTLSQPADRACIEDTSHGSWHRSLPKRHGAERTGRLARSGNLLDPHQAAVRYYVLPTVGTLALYLCRAPLFVESHGNIPKFSTAARVPSGCGCGMLAVYYACRRGSGGYITHNSKYPTVLWLGAISRICPLWRPVLHAPTCRCFVSYSEGTAHPLRGAARCTDTLPRRNIDQ